MAGHRVLGFLATAPLAIPGIVLGVGLFLAYTRPPLTLYGTLWILLIAFITIELPAAYQQLASAFHAVHPELEEAGRMLGASRLRTLDDITAPLLRSAVIATWCFIFVAVIRELSRRRDPVHLGDQGPVGADLRPQGKRRRRRHRGAEPDHGRLITTVVVPSPIASAAAAGRPDLHARLAWPGTGADVAAPMRVPGLHAPAHRRPAIVHRQLRLQARSSRRL